MTDLKSLLPEELEAFLCETGESAYRARQVFEWVPKKDVADFAQMTDLPLSLREKLARTAFVTAASVEKKLVSARDGTVKFWFGFEDGEKVESVLMRYKHGNTVCISTQAGCRMGCAFCASTLNGLKRNLTPAEMLALAQRIMDGTIPPFCPHGRPCVLKITRKELEKQFGRLV